MKALVICGATATGKSALAVDCAKRLGGEIVSCDAFQLYRGLDIGTAKPDKAERAEIPHHMIDVCDPADSFSASDFERMALPIVGEIFARGKVPILCGGTGFYLNALLYRHTFGGAPADGELREKYASLERERGREYLHGLLREVDPESAEKLHPNDVKRVVRALEIYERTGRKKSEQKDGEEPRFPYLAYAYDYPRAELYARIDRRVELMLESGLVGEVEGLLRAGVPESAQSMQGIGYKEVVDFLKNGTEYSTMSDIIKKNTRNYAKRQLTFFKRMKGLRLIPPATTGKEIAEEYEKYGR